MTRAEKLRGVAVLGLLALSAWIYFSGPSLKKPADDQPPSPAVVTAGSQVSADAATFVAVDLLAFDRLNNLQRAKDESGVFSLVSQRRVVMVPAGTKGLAIQVAGDAAEVKVENGPLSGRYLVFPLSSLRRAD